MEEEAGSAVGEAQKRKRDGEYDAGEEERDRARGSKEEAGPSEVGKGGSSKRVAEDEESEEKTAEYLKSLAREAKGKERDGDQDEGRDGVDEVVVAGQVVNEEVAVETAGWERWPEMDGGGEDELDEEQVKVGRKEEKD